LKARRQRRQKLTWYGKYGKWWLWFDFWPTKNHFRLPKKLIEFVHSSKHHLTTDSNFKHVHSWWLHLSLWYVDPLQPKLNFRQNIHTCYSKLQRFVWETSSLIQFVCKKTHTTSYLSWDFSCKIIQFAQSFFYEKNSRWSVMLVHNWMERKRNTWRDVIFNSANTTLT